MPIEGSPKKYAEDISNGLVLVNKAVFKKYSPQDLKIIFVNLRTVLRDIRATFVETSNFDAIKEKNVRMQRINNAITVLSHYCKVLRIPL